MKFSSRVRWKTEKIFEICSFFDFNEQFGHSKNNLSNRNKANNLNLPAHRSNTPALGHQNALGYHFH